MKLLRKTGLIHLTVTSILLALAGALIYWLMTGIIDEETNEKLWVNNRRVAKQLEKGEEPAFLPPVIEFYKTASAGDERLRIFDTLVFDPVEGEKELFREVSSWKEINGEWYKITTRQVILEPHDYLESIGLSLAIVLVLLLLSLWLSNRSISKSIWKPFFTNLEKLRHYQLNADQKIDLKPSRISEFRELNEVLEKLITKVSRDYRNLKEFSENAAHEMQTPLAISQGRMEQLLQKPSLQAAEAEEINISLRAIKRLKRLNQNLILLTKLDNNALQEKDNLDLKSLLKQQLTDMEELIVAREISLVAELKEKKVKIPAFSADLLISNLLSNAIKHNVDQGSISIELAESHLKIENTGGPLQNPEKMFERFAKGQQSSSSLGLGLAIVAKICELQAWPVNYQVKQKIHQITIKF